VAGNDFLALFGRPKRSVGLRMRRTSKRDTGPRVKPHQRTAISDSLGAPANRIAKIVEGEKDDQKWSKTFTFRC